MSVKRPTTVIAIVVAAIVALSVAALVFSLGRNADTYDAGTPEAAAQDYLTAAFDGNYDKAASFIDASSDCDADDLDRAYIDDSARISLVESVIEGDRARVRVNVELPSGGPIGGFFGEEHTLRLVKTADSWVLTGVPWPLYDCSTPNE
jgi:hypothetical protein